MNNSTQPLLSFEKGNFGTHIIQNPKKTYSFVGNVPEDFRGKSFDSEDKGIQAFVDWFRDQDVDFQKKHVGNLRNDVFELLITNS